jgi:protein tyrosine/serine phosphatase
MLKYAHRVIRPYVRALQNRYRGARRSISGDRSSWLSRSIDRLLEHFDLIMVDHGAIRAIYPNRHRIAPGVWRSSQPAPHQVAWLARKGVRTIVNLRGDRDCGSYRLAKAACQRYGVHLVDFPAKSREAPSRAFFHDANMLFQSIEYPMLMHCKSGADRVGLMSTLYLILAEGRPAEEAVRQLGLRYGHIKQAETGILDAIFAAYIADNRRAPIAFLDWIDTRYDPVALKKGFAARRWGNFVVDGVLARE